jgi:hypothetical protein
MPSFNFQPTDVAVNPLMDYASMVDAANKMQAGRIQNQLGALNLDSAQLQNNFQHAVQPQQINGMLQSYKEYLQPQANGSVPQGVASPLASAGGAPGAAQPVSQFAQRLGAAEGGANPAVVNSRGYSGQFQFGAERLSDPGVGVYHPAEGENLKANEWRGTFNIPGFPNVRTHDDFLRDPQAQRAVFGSHVADIDRAIAQTPGADRLDPNGLRAVAHLGGVQGMQKFVASGGQYNPGDNPGAPGGGTHLKDYYLKFTEGGPAALQQAFGHPDGPHAPVQLAANGNMASDAPGFAGQSLTAQAGVQPSYVTPQIQGGQSPQAAAEALAVARQARLGMSLGLFTPGMKGLDAAAKFQNSLDSMAKDGTVVGPNGVVMLPGAERGQMLINQAREQGKVGPEVQKANATKEFATQQDMMAHRANSAVDVGAAWQKPEKVGPGDSMGAASSFVAAANAPRPPVNTLAGGANDGITPSPMSAAPGIFQAPGNRLTTVKNADGSETTIDPSTRQAVHQSGPMTFGLKESEYKTDKEQVSKIADSGMAAQTSQVRIQQMRDLVDKLGNTGAGGTTKAQIAALVQTYLPDQATKFLQDTAGMSDAAASQELSKLALRGAGDQERGVLGSRGGYQATKLFQAMNPGLDLLPGANKAILNSQLIGAQADADYSQAALNHFNTHGGAFKNGQTPDYRNLDAFDQQWLQQRNPQVYAAAMGALAGLPATDGQIDGKPVKGWARGLSEPEYARALQVVSRADPGATVQGKTGRLSMQPSTAQQSQGGGQPAQSAASAQRAPAMPAVGTIMQGHRFLGGDPSKPASWQAVQ